MLRNYFHRRHRFRACMLLKPERLRWLAVLLALARHTAVGQGWVDPTPAARTLFRLPFDGDWVVGWGGRSPFLNKHFSSIDQRYAYDFIGTPPTSCIGRPIVAPAAGTVVAAVDGIADSPLGVPNNAAPAGNHVILKHAEGEFSVLAHFMLGSVGVGVGQRVEAGAFLGKCGNSGASTGPHLHFHVQNTPFLFRGTGLPATFSNFSADGQEIARGEPVRFQQVRQLADEKESPEPKAVSLSHEGRTDYIRWRFCEKREGGLKFSASGGFTNIDNCNSERNRQRDQGLLVTECREAAFERDLDCNRLSSKPQRSGCELDSDCKGTRVCRNERCVSAPSDEAYQPVPLSYCCTLFGKLGPYENPARLRTGDQCWGTDNLGAARIGMVCP